MIERRFARDFGSLEAIYAFVREFVRERGILEDHAWNLDLMAEELFTNMVRYGPGPEPVAISLDWERPTLTLRLRESGASSFDPTRVPDVDLTQPIEERRAGGLGIHLVRQIADRLEYARTGSQSTITVTKRLEP
jgi:anti-sigma regulatory factor (Ser/Thr protein kinase)